MPELPKTLQRSERHAQAVWLKTLESAIETYGGDTVCRRVEEGAT